MQGMENEENGIMFGFGLSYYDNFAVYLHLPWGLLDELVQKYLLVISHQGESLTATQFLLRGSDSFTLN